MIHTIANRYCFPKVSVIVTILRLLASASSRSKCVLREILVKERGSYGDTIYEC